MSVCAADRLRGLLTTVCNHVGYEVVDGMSEEQLADFIKDLAAFAGAEAGVGGDAVATDYLGLAREIKDARDRLLELMRRPRIEQRTPIWYEVRENMLTASNLAQALNKGKFASRNALLKEKITKVSTFDSSNDALRWGTMFEDMVMRCYLQLLPHRVAVHDFGLILHPEIDCFGASPDGITAWGIMLELKAPYKRDIEPGQVPIQYYYQIQGQLSACGLKECDYVEAKMHVYGALTQYCEAHKNERKLHGVIIEYKPSAGDTVCDNSDNSLYLYSQEGMTGEEASEWALSEAARLSNSAEFTLVAIKPWRMVNINIVRVNFDAELWNETVPRIHTFWNEVKEGRRKLAEGTLEFKTRKPSKPRARKESSNDNSAHKKSKYDFVDDDD